jgi:hypothetical protein
MEYDEVLHESRFSSLSLFLMDCGDEIEEYEEVFTNTQFIGFIVVTK